MNRPDTTSIPTLNKLIATCADGYQGYLQAADALLEDHPKAAIELRRLGRSRGRLTERLQEEVSRRGGDPTAGGTFTGAVHRGWIGLKNALSSDRVEAILDECVRGERAAVDAFTSALGEPLDDEARATVIALRDEIQAAQLEVEGLRPVLQS